MKSALYLRLFLYLLFANGQTLYAQISAREPVKNVFTAKRWQAGIKDGYGQGDLFRNHNVFQVHTGYYIADKLLIGMSASWTKEWVGTIAFNDFAVGPLVRYQFTQTLFSPFIEASYQFGRRSANEVWRSSYPGSSALQMASISPGLSIKLASPLWIDLSYGLQFTTLGGFTHSYGKPQVGINYLVGRN